MKEYWVTNSRFKLIVIILVLMWIGLMVFFFIEGENIRKDPCSICAKQQGENVVCSVGASGYMAQRTYYPNGSIFDYGG